MDKGQEILEIDFPTRTLEVEGFAKTIEGRDMVTDKTINPSIETDYKIARFLKERFSFNPTFFKSYDGVRTPYRFVHVLHQDTLKGKHDNLGYHSIASVIEAYLVGEDGKVESLDNVKDIILVSFFVPIMFDSRNTYYNEGILMAVDYENVFQGKRVSEDAIKEVVETNSEIAVTSASVFAAFDPMQEYKGQKEKAVALFSRIKANKDKILEIANTMDLTKRSLPEIMKQQGIETTVPKVTCKEIYDQS